jgi:methionine-rich copper-binding protein CopC
MTDPTDPTGLTWTPKRGLVPRVLACLLFALGALVWSAAPGQAHTELIGSDPASGQRLDAAPERVELTFNQTLLGSGAAVRLRDSAGATVATEAAVVQGAAVTVALPAGLAGGAYEVTWRVVAGDGHPIEGRFSFAVAAAAAPTAAATTTPAAALTAGPTEPAAVPTPLAERDATSTAEVSLASTAAVVFGAAAALAVAVALVVRARRR